MSTQSEAIFESTLIQQLVGLGYAGLIGNRGSNLTQQFKKGLLQEMFV